MAEGQDLKVFISWSGRLAKDVAVALRKWLPDIFDNVKPWASDSDIAGGQRGLNEIEASLAGAQYGIIVVTQENLNAQWLNFEAGALSRAISREEQRVTPLAVDFNTITDVTGPIGQFQGKLASRQDIHDLVMEIAELAGADSAVVERRFEVFWPQLESDLESARSRRSASKKPNESRRSQDDLLSEILTHVRAIRRDVDRGDMGTSVDEDHMVGDVMIANGISAFRLEGVGTGKSRHFLVGVPSNTPSHVMNNVTARLRAAGMRVSVSPDVEVGPFYVEPTQETESSGARDWGAFDDSKD